MLLINFINIKEEEYIIHVSTHVICLIPYFNKQTQNFSSVSAQRKTGYSVTFDNNVRFNSLEYQKL